MVLDRPSIVSGPKPAGMASGKLARWSALAACGFVVLYLAAVATPTGQLLDDVAMLRLSALVDSRQWAVLALHWVSAGSLLGLSAALGLVTWVLRGRGIALLGVLTTGAVVVGAQLLKLLLLRPDLLVGSAANSYPSGHVAVVAGLAAALVVGAAPGMARRVALVLLTPVVGLAGLATVVLQWHRPSDVLGSVLLAVALGGLATLLADRRGRPRRGTTAEPAPPGCRVPGALLAPRPSDRADSDLRAGSRG